jgi:hypothetical protein
MRDLVGIKRCPLPWRLISGGGRAELKQRTHGRLLFAPAPSSPRLCPAHLSWEVMSEAERRLLTAVAASGSSTQRASLLINRVLVQRPAPTDSAPGWNYARSSAASELGDTRERRLRQESEEETTTTRLPAWRSSSWLRTFRLPDTRSTFWSTRAVGHRHKAVRPSRAGVAARYKRLTPPIYVPSSYATSSPSVDRGRAPSPPDDPRGINAYRVQDPRNVWDA